MIDVEFTGTFLKPVEAFVRQSFDASELNRLPPEFLYWTIGITALALVVHLIVQGAPLLRGRKERK